LTFSTKNDKIHLVSMFEAVRCAAVSRYLIAG